VSSLAFGLAAYLGGDTVPLKSTFAQLSLAVQQLGQWENSGDITPAILLQAINFALLEGYDIVTQKWLDYYTTQTDFLLTSGVDSYPLTDVAPGLYKLRHLDYTPDVVVSSTTRWTPMLPHAVDGAHMFSGRTSSGRRAPRYRMQGPVIVLAPPPDAGTIRVFYIPAPYQFSDVNDTNEIVFDVPIEIRLVVQIAQRDLLERSDLSTTDCDAKIGRLTGLLRSAADARDAGEPFYLNPAGPRRENGGGWLGYDEDW
jgi:hypothetical protein